MSEGWALSFILYIHLSTSIDLRKLDFFKIIANLTHFFPNRPCHVLCLQSWLSPSMQPLGLVWKKKKMVKNSAKLELAIYA